MLAIPIDEATIEMINEMLPLKYRNSICRQLLVHPEAAKLLPHRELFLLNLFSLPIPAFLDLYVHVLEVNLRDGKKIGASVHAMDGITMVRDELRTLLATLEGQAIDHYSDRND